MKSKLIMVLFLTLLVGTIGSKAYSRDWVENKGNHYCYLCKVVFDPLKENHENCNRQIVSVAPDTSSYGQLKCEECNTHYPASMRHVCPLPSTRTIAKVSRFNRTDKTVYYKTGRHSGFKDKSVALPTIIENLFALFHIHADVRVYQQRDRLVLVREYVPGVGDRYVKRYNFFRDIADYDGEYRGYVRSRDDGRYRYGD